MRCIIIQIFSSRYNFYKRYDAINYAVKFALNPNTAYRYFPSVNDGGGDCSNFISQCLRSGGAPFDYKSNRPWWYNNKNTLNVFDDTWSISWAVAHSLYWCLKVRGQLKMPGLEGIEVQSVDMLDLGDIIQYENYNEKIYHSAIITGFTNNQGVREPLITQHTFNAANIYYIKPAAKKMHFMKIQIV